MVILLNNIIPIRLKYLKKENYYGNCEYKWKLIEVSPLKIQKLATQMSFRLTEGSGKAVYILGVRDDGTDVGMTTEELTETYTNVCKAAEVINAEIIKTKTYLRNVTTIRIISKLKSHI